MDRMMTLLNEHPERPLFIAIDGHSAAGKSTLAEQLVRQLPEALVIHMDDFYRVMDEDERFHLTPEAGYHRYYDWQRLEADVLKPLKAGKPARFQRYDWHSNTLDKVVEVAPDEIIIIEGCYSSRPELRAYFHLILYMETPEAVRMHRQQQRGDAESWLARWDAAERYYFSNHPPKSFASLVIRKEEVSA